MECIISATKSQVDEFRSFFPSAAPKFKMENVPSPQRQNRAESSELDYLDFSFKPTPAALPLPHTALPHSRSPEKRVAPKGLRSPTKTLSRHSSPVRRAAPLGKFGRINSDELLQSFLAVDQEMKYRSQSSNKDRIARGTATLDRNRLSVQTAATSERGGSPVRNRDRLQLPSSDCESEGELPRLSDRSPRRSTASLAPTTVASTRHSLSTTVHSPSVYNKSSSTPPSSDKKRRRPLSNRGGKRHETAKEKQASKARKTDESRPLRTDQLISYLPRRNTKVAVRRDGDSETEEESSVEESDQSVRPLCSSFCD